MSRDQLLEAFDEIASADLRGAIVAAVQDAAFIESLVSDGSDSYMKTAGGSQSAKPESSTPSGVEYANHYKKAKSAFESVSSLASRITVRLDELRVIHDHGRAHVENEKQRRPKSRRKHFERLAAEYAVKSEEDERG